MHTTTTTDNELMARIRESGLGTYREIEAKGEAGICLIQAFLYTYAIRANVDVHYLGDRWCYKTYARASGL